MILRWRLVGSMVLLVAGLFVVALVIVFCGENGVAPEGPTAHTTSVASPTVRPIAPTRTRGPATPGVTGTPGLAEPGDGEAVPWAESPVLAPAETPVQVIPEEAPSVPPLPGETASPIPVSPLPDETATLIPPSARASPLPTLTPTPIRALPDLVVRDLRVRRDRIVVVIGNDGEGDVLAGQTVEIGVRGIVAESLVMPVTLSKEEGLTIVLEDQVLYRREKVMGRVDPNDLIPEEEDNNNSLTKELLPDVPVDLGVVALLGIGTEQHLAVYIRNNTEAPILGADVSVQVFRSGAQEPVTEVQQTLNLDPFEIAQVDIFHQVATRGVFFRVVMKVINLPDADPLNNTFERTIP